MAAGSPSTARAGHHTRLSASGAWATTASDSRIAKRDKLPYDMIAAACSTITKSAPITAATICATKRVRRAPMVRNKATVSATAQAAAAVPMATMTA